MQQNEPLQADNIVRIERYFTKEGVHPFDEITWEIRTAEIKNDKGESLFKQEGVEVPSFWSMTATNIVASKYFRGKMGSPEREYSVKQLIGRVVNRIEEWAIAGTYFEAADAKVFKEELTHILVNQMAAFNSPVFFNLGTNDKEQSSACFILSVEDDMASILDLAKTEGMIFKYGSGAGINLSKLRGSQERLSVGGEASGPVSFMRGLDSFAGAIKSGGRARRSALLRCLNVDHPDIEEFIECKTKEEKKAQALIAAGYDSSYNGESYKTVQFQNANNSVRVTDAFMRAAENNESWDLKAVTTGEVLKTLPATDLLRKVAEHAWQSGDPGIQFHDTINAQNTVAASGIITGQNPCRLALGAVLTPYGISTIGNTVIGDTIWSGKQWTTVINKIATGIKPAFAYRTRAGTFYGTDCHKIVENGVKTEVKNASSIDTSLGPIAETDPLDPQDIMDGLVLGDGTVHKANRYAAPFLCVGKDDQDYHSSEIASLLTEDFAKDKNKSYTMWRVTTTLSRDEVPRTFDRKVPSRFYYGNSQKVRGFLRGLYSANGSLCGGRVTLKTASPYIREQVQEMLSSIGIPSYHTVNKPTAVKFSNGIYTCKESYDVNITTGRRLFRELIGFIHVDKQRRLNEACEIPPADRAPKANFEIVEVQELGEQEVFDITVDDPEHVYWSGGLSVSNCGEFNFISNTSCNLASLNLLKFKNYDTSFNVRDFKKVTEIMITAQEILVGFSHYPTELIEKNSHEMRPLGIGYSNLGALLMECGYAYDSDKGRNLAAGVTSLLSGHSYKISAHIAKRLGAFKAFEKNKESMLSVIQNHRNSNDKLSPFLNGVREAAIEAWDEALEVGQVHGFRNAQISVVAPVGTIGFMMDCATTGLEPPLSLVAYKKLAGAGDGTMRLVNTSVGAALHNLGYSAEESKKIVQYVEDNGTIEGSTLLPEHLPVFDCALSPAGSKRSIHWKGHVKMCAAIQPFLSGASSKTINFPEETTVDDIYNAYIEAWKLGLKSIAIYRNNSKKSQPVTTSKQPVTIQPAKQVRRKLPDERPSITHKFSIGGQEGYLTVGLYEDGSPGELFVVMSKEGTIVSGLINSLAEATSISLQYGVPLSVLVKKFSHTKFDPSGFTQNPDIRIASSIVDYIFRWMELKFLKAKINVVVQQSSLLEVTDTRALPMLSMDTPPCTDCGSMTVRNGTCYKCENCGGTSGCS